jgi:hydrogenase expression/formation protein HypD
MKFVTEYRGEPEVRKIADRLHSLVTRPWNLMEVCGGQTHTLVKSGLLGLLPPQVQMVHGPGCPVCVTPIELIDRALDLARRPNVILCSFGDMLRVPGSQHTLLDAKASGADVRIVYTPMDALQLALRFPEREVVFFGVGFETTAPTIAIVVSLAARRNIRNFSVLVAHVLAPPAMRAILADPECRVDGFLAPGHVCTITGMREYEEIASTYKVPIVVTGFEPLDLIDGIRLTIEQLERGEARVENQYSRAVRSSGNVTAQAVLEDVFEVSARKWRGIGEIPSSGLAIRQTYANFDAERRFTIDLAPVAEPAECIAGQVLRGVAKPPQCPMFGLHCTPEKPLGAPMVSSEGACAAYYRYGQHHLGQQHGSQSLVSLAASGD